MIVGLDNQTHADLHAHLQALAGVDSVVMDPERRTLWVICGPDADPARVDLAIRNAFENFALDPAALNIEMAVRGRRAGRRRVRFETAEQLPTGAELLCVRITLGWRGALYSGEATAPVDTPPTRIRAGAAATVRALEALIGRDLGLRIIAFKEFRIFDRAMIAVSLADSEQRSHQVGIASADPDPLRAAALAVLNAINTLFEDFLESDD